MRYKNNMLSRFLPESIVILDIEASSLHIKAFPTELSWINLKKDKNIRSYLIKPTHQWINRGLWDINSEKITGITKDMLINKGVSINELIVKVKRVIESPENIVLTDAPDWDYEWMKTLYKAAGDFSKAPKFSNVYHYMQFRLNSSLRSNRQPQHRAGKDVSELCHILELSMNNLCEEFNLINDYKLIK